MPLKIHSQRSSYRLDIAVTPLRTCNSVLQSLATCLVHHKTLLRWNDTQNATQLIKSHGDQGSTASCCHSSGSNFLEAAGAAEIAWGQNYSVMRYSERLPSTYLAFDRVLGWERTTPSGLFRYSCSQSPFHAGELSQDSNVYDHTIYKKIHGVQLSMIVKLLRRFRIPARLCRKSSLIFDSPKIAAALPRYSISVSSCRATCKRLAPKTSCNIFIL